MLYTGKLIEFKKEECTIKLRDMTRIKGVPIELFRAISEYAVKTTLDRFGVPVCDSEFDFDGSKYPITGLFVDGSDSIVRDVYFSSEEELSVWRIVSACIINTPKSFLNVHDE